MDIENTLDEIAFGWASLEKLEDDRITVSMSNPQSDYKKPLGFEEPLQMVDKKGMSRTLMITEPRTSLIYPFLENKSHWENAIEDLLGLLEAHSFTGVLVDFENIRNTEIGYKKLYLEFLRELKQSLDLKEYTLSVAVQPNNVVGYYDGYDYMGISKIADEIIVMAYDYYDRNNRSTPTDHAPIYKVKEALDNLIKEGAHSDQIILGLQVAGATQWIFNKSSGAVGPSEQIYTPAMSSVYKRLQISGDSGTIKLNPQTMTPSFRYSILEDGKEQDIVIQYENKESIESKIMLGKYYGIKGISIWRIGEIQKDILELLQY